MCTDFNDLNKAFSKDAYPLLNIDGSVDDASSHQILNFLDAYFGFNQITMYHSRKDKTTFIIKQTNYYYDVMLVDLKNVGATYQRLIDMIFHHQVSWCMDIYMDYMVVRS